MIYFFHIEPEMNKASDPTISERTAMIVVITHFQSIGFLNNGFSHRYTIPRSVSLTSSRS